MRLNVDRWVRVSARIVCLAMVAIGCRTGPPPDFAGQTLHGMVYDGENQPVALVAVRVDGGRAVNSDMNGRFALPGVTQGSVTVVARRDGYRDVQEVIAVANRSQVLYIRMLSSNDVVALAVAELDRGRYQSAHELALEAVELSPDSPVARFVAAVAAHLAHHPDDATRHLDWFGASPPEAVALLRAAVLTGRAERSP